MVALVERTSAVVPLPRARFTALVVAESGTVTRTASQSFGSISDRPPSGDVEIRASWTPLTPDVGAHLAAWGDVLVQVAGLPPLPPGVATLPVPRRR